MASHTRGIDDTMRLDGIPFRATPGAEERSAKLAQIRAAAPELAEALRYLLSFYSYHDEKLHHSGDNQRCGVCNARAALRKAGL